MKKKILSVLLSTIMIVGMIPLSAVSAFAKENQRISVTYIDENGDEHTAENCIKMASSEAVDDFSFEAGEWYVVNGTYTVNNRIENNAPADNPAHLILGYGAVLNANMGIHNPEGKGLIIFTHSESVPGTLVADTPRKPVNFNSNAGIGGNSREAGGNLMICGGEISAIGGYTGGAGIGGGYGGNGGSITITGGTVTAIGGEADGGAGIGGGSYGGAGGNITITGGKVTAKGLTMSAGIGGGEDGTGGNITITGGEVIAQGSVAPAIGAGYDGANNGKFILGEGLDMFVGFSPKYCSYQIYQLYAYTLDYYVEIIGSPSYTVKHFKQNEDKTGYELAETETLTGHTGDKTTASFKWYDGFAPLVFNQQTIEKDGSTVVEIYYNKSMPSHEHTFSSDWSYDETKHWHMSNCGHSSITSDLAEHTYIEMEDGFGGITYTCSECGYTMPADKKVTGVTLDSNKEVLLIGDTVTLATTVLPDTAENKAVNWSSLDSDIATVSADGVVTAKSAGSTVITAETADGGYKGFCLIRVAGITPILNTTAAVDYDNGIISGIAPMLDNLDSFVETSEDSLTLAYSTETIGTGTIVNVVRNGEVIDAYTAVLFGDVNNDGIYDGTDAIIVNCLANGLLSREQVGEAVYMAADCNHDAVIDSLDIELLQQAGVLLASVDQSKSEAELMTSSAYVEYLNLIDQTVEDEQPTPEIEPARPEPLIFRIVNAIALIFWSVVNFFANLFD